MHSPTSTIEKHVGKKKETKIAEKCVTKIVVTLLGEMGSDTTAKS